MSEEVQRVEVITSVQRRRRWSVAEKIRLVEETLQPGMSVSFVARKHGLSPSLLFKWRQRMAEGGREAVRVDDVPRFKHRHFGHRRHHHALFFGFDQPRRFRPWHDRRFVFEDLDGLQAHRQSMPGSRPGWRAAPRRAARNPP